MLNIYCGRESINREKFIYKTIKERDGHTLVIVPDQYTLEGEKQALYYMDRDVLLDVEITSISRLGSRLIKTCGGGDTTFINRYGRLMLITKIVSEMEEELHLYGSSAKKTTFIEAVDDLISRLKQNNITADELEDMARQQEGLFGEKLQDMAGIFSEYERRIGGKYTDAEDYISLYAEKIQEAEFIEDSSVWIYGFDNFTSRNMEVIRGLALCAQDVNIVLNFDHNCEDQQLFDLSSSVIRKLKDMAEQENIGFKVFRISDVFLRKERSAGICAVESQLFAENPKPCYDSKGVHVIRCAGIYGEAETAASIIRGLTREQGMKYSDIVVINNDRTVRGSVIDRVFQEYEIDTFEDNRRPVISSPIAIFILSLVETVAERYRTGDIFKVLKTGLSNITREETEQLENYGIKYRIRGTMWKKPFTKGSFEYGEKGLEQIEALRQKAMNLFEGFEKIYRKSETCGEFLQRYYDFLVQETPVLEKTENLMMKQQEKGYGDRADATGQAFGAVMDVFSQMNELLGDSPFDGKEFVKLVTAGLSRVEIGVIPPVSDQVMIGTMQRTRSGSVKAMIVMGANEGTIPMALQEDPIFTSEELERLAQDSSLSTDSLRIMEENMAIYRNFSKPEEQLILLYSQSDIAGDELRKSQFVERIERIFPELEEEKDVLNRNTIRPALGGRVNTLRHFTEEVREAEKAGKIHPDIICVGRWLNENCKEDYDRIARGLVETGGGNRLSPELAEKLYERTDQSDSIVLSPSSIEKYSRCAFSHFINYGLKPDERRIYEAGGREIGDLYHNVIMQVSVKLTEEDSWHTITEEECEEVVTSAIKDWSDNYRDGIFGYDGGEKYKLNRACKVLKSVMWTLIEHVRSGQIKETAFEIPFKRHGDIPAIEMDFADCKVFIEGKIDRVDITDSDRVKIIDYKTGNEQFNIKEAEQGYRLQLMLYLQAAQQWNNHERKPAGVFYFLIKEPVIGGDSVNVKKSLTKDKLFEIAQEKLDGKIKKSSTKGDLLEMLEEGLSEDEFKRLSFKSQKEISEEIREKIRKSFKLNGIMVDEDENLKDIAGDFSGNSDIVQIKKSKEGVVESTTQDMDKRTLLSEEEFMELQTCVRNVVRDTAHRLISGDIDAKPMKTGDTSACTFCQYRGICRFDTEFEGCRYRFIR